jgi:cyclase
MTHQSLIVARIAPHDVGAVADIFAESDASELPHLLGVTERALFEFHGVYMHLVRTEQDVRPALDEIRSHPLFRKIDTELSRYVKAYEPETWKSPRDAMAKEFYLWRR